MFEGLKNNFGYKIGADIPEPTPGGESVIPPQPMQSTIPEPTPIGEPTTTPRFSDLVTHLDNQPTPLGEPTPQPKLGDLVNSLQPKFQDTTMQSATAEKETPGVFKDTEGKIVNGVLVDQTPIIDINEPGKSIWQRITDMNTSIVSPEEITSGLAQLKQHLESEQQAGYQEPNILVKAGTTVTSNVGLGIVSALQGLDQGINQLSSGLGGVLSGKPTVKDFGDVALGGLMSSIGIIFPGTTAAFAVASQTPIVKDLIQGFSDLGKKQFEDVTSYIPGVNQLTPDQRGQFLDFAKYAIAGIILHMGLSKIAPTGKAIVPTEGEGNLVKYQEASKTLDRKEGQDLNQAFREKSLETHPDRPGGSTEAQQKVNEAYTYLKGEGFKEAWKDIPEEQKATIGSTLKAMREKAKGYVQENQAGLSLKVLKGKYIDLAGNEVPVPKTPQEYKYFAQKMSNGEITTPDKLNEQNKNVIQQSVLKADPQRNTFIKEIANIEAQEQRIGKVGGVKVSKETTNNQMKERESKKESVIKSLGETYNLDTNQANDMYAQLRDLSVGAIQKASTKETSANQLEQIDAFLTDHEDFTDPNAKAKLDKVLAGEKVSDNGINYNKEVEKIIQRNLDKNIEEPIVKSPTELVAEMEAKESQPTLKSPTIPEYKAPTENIKEKTLYHSTLENFDNFDINKAGGFTEYDNAKRGFFFSDSAKNTQDFMEVARKSNDTRPVRTIEANVDIKNPIDLTLHGILTKPKQAKIILKALGYTDPVTPQEALDILDDTIDLGSIGDFYETIYSNIENKKLFQKAGYDGIVAQMGMGEDRQIMHEYVAFNTNQIKIKKGEKNPTEKQPEIQPATIPERMPGEQVTVLTDKLKKMVPEEAKNNLGTRLKDKTLNTILQGFVSQLPYQPSMVDIKQAYKDPKILYEALNLAKQKQILNPQELGVMNGIVDNIVNAHNKNISVVNSETNLNQKQKAVFLKWEDFKTPIKGIEDIKIKMEPINNFLKDNPGEKVHVIETPRVPDIKPFAMVGTKENTYAQVMKPHVMRAIQQGKQVYIEPYGGVGTALYHLPDYFNQGLKEANLNLFDIEKYTIVKAIKDQTMNVEKDVTEAYDNVVKEITDQLMTNDEFKKIYTEAQMGQLAGLEVGSKQFREALMLLGFHPELAKEFFRQNMDSKIVKNGEITTTFKDWIAETMVKPEIKAQFPDLEGIELDEAVKQGVEDVLSKPGLFEKQYGGMSEAVKTILDKYDSDQYVSNLGGDYKKALLTAIARQFRQRGTSGQKVISPSDGFTSIEGVRDRMIASLKRYDATMKLYGPMINLFNQDGQKFINDMSHDLRKRGAMDQSAWYMDPPYIKSNSMYTKNNPELRYTLGKYSDYEGIKEIFRPAVSDKNTLLFTNDVDGKYFQSLKDLMGERMAKDIYAYKEGLTPTSFITTSDIGRGMKDNQFLYYMLNKNAKIMEAVQFIDQLGGDIAKGLKKNIAKILSYVSPEMQKNLDKLEQIRSGVEKAEAKYQDLVDTLDLVTTGREKQKLLSEAKAEVKKGYLTGKPLLKLIDTIGRNLVNLNTEQRSLRKRIDNFQKSESADAEIKKRFFDEFNKEYTTKKLTQAEQSSLKIKSIYSLNIDEVDELNKMFKEYSEMARESRIKTEAQKQEEIDYQVNETKELMKSGKATPLESERDPTEKIALKGISQSILAYMDQYLTFSDNMFERLGMERIKRQTDQSKLRTDAKESELIDPIYKKIKEYDMKHEDMQKIGLYGLLKRGDNLGKVKVFAQLTKIGDPLKKLSRIGRIKKKFGAREPLSETEAKMKMEEYSQDNFLNPKQKKIYDMMREAFDEAHKIGSKTMLEEKNKLVKYIEDYRPILGNREFNKADYKEENYDMTELEKSLAKKSVTQTLDKQTTAKETVPIIEAHTAFSHYIRSTIYYSEMQPIITKLTKVVNALGKETLGTRAIDYFHNKETGYLPDLARQGKSVLSRGERQAEKLVSGFSKSILLLNPSTLLRQLTNVFDTAMSGKGGISLETLKKYIQTRGGYAKTVLDRSQFLQNRMGQDRIQVIQDTFRDMMEGKLQKIENLEGKILNAWDMTVGITINDFMYRQGIHEGLSHKEAQYQADVATKKAIGSFEHPDLPQFNRFFKGYLSPIRMFQTFVQNRRNLVRYQTLGEKVATGKKLMNITYLLLAGLTEAYIAYLVSKKIWGSKKPFTIGSVAVNTITSMIPGSSNVIKTDMYGNVQIDPLNFQTLTSLGQGFTELKSAVTGKSKRSWNQVIGNLIADFSPFLRIPGGTTVGRLIAKPKIGGKSGGAFGHL